jgi:hypothetical protein
MGLVLSRAEGGPFDVVFFPALDVPCALDGAERLS